MTIKKRVPRFIGSVACFSVGTVIGYRIGDFVGLIFIYVLAGNVSPLRFCLIVYLLARWNLPYPPCEITQENIQRSIYFSKTLFSFIGMAYFAMQMREVHRFYYYLREIKTQHSFKYYRFRHYFFEIDNPHIDMVYSFIYTILKSSIPIVVSAVSGATVLTMTFPIFTYVSLLFALITAIFTFNWADETLWWLLHPHRIEWENNEADIIQGVLARNEMEEKQLGQVKRKDELVEGDEDEEDDEE